MPAWKTLLRVPRAAAWSDKVTNSSELCSCVTHGQQQHSPCGRTLPGVYNLYNLLHTLPFPLWGRKHRNSSSENTLRLAQTQFQTTEVLILPELQVHEHSFSNGMATTHAPKEIPCSNAHHGSTAAD